MHGQRAGATKSELLKARRIKFPATDGRLGAVERENG
jgi:hypothetical protein